jgi:riboflavin kinase/FMN adenylyltransferase
MRLYDGLREFVPPPGGTVLTIGNFDGVHRGHGRLIETARALAEKHGAQVTALTFHPHPLAVLAPERAPTPLTTLAEKLALLERLGVAGAIVLKMDRALLAQEAVDFLASLVAHCRPRAVVEGPDFHFGHQRSGSIATLQEHAAHWGYEVHVVGAVRCADLPTNPTINSSSIRQAVRDGRIAEANAMLGRPYRLTGWVGTGAQRGAGLGFPTVNLARIVHLLPQEAVYAAIAQRAGGELHLSAVNIGPQPTFASAQVRVEAHLLDFEGELRGQRIGLYFLVRLREQQKFPTPTALCEQLQRDVAATRALAPALDKLREGGLLPLD